VELLQQLQPGEEMTITEDGRPLARIQKVGRPASSCQAGGSRKAEFWIAPDFDAPLDDFKPYME
jgi:antitoxin (DNA-binding transcriptional repressor) of toxin-antitoxin stability system